MPITSTRASYFTLQVVHGHRNKMNRKVKGNTFPSSV